MGSSAVYGFILLLFFSTGTTGAKRNRWRNGKIWFKPVPKPGKVWQACYMIVIYNMCDYTLACHVIISWLCFTCVSDFLMEREYITGYRGATSETDCGCKKNLLQLGRAVFKASWASLVVSFVQLSWSDSRSQQWNLPHCVSELAVGSYSTLRGSCKHGWGNVLSKCYRSKPQCNPHIHPFPTHSL